MALATAESAKPVFWAKIASVALPSDSCRVLSILASFSPSSDKDSALSPACLLRVFCSELKLGIFGFENRYLARHEGAGFTV